MGLEAGGYLEPKPGISPSPKHLQELIQRMKKENTALILKESFFSAEVPDFVAEKTGAKVVEVPVYSEDYIGMMDTIVKKIVMSFPRRRESQTSKIEIPAFAGMTDSERK
jgi:ABC-type Zn uptake system ZnuABC Zn-binding protein ZnuA